MSFDPGTLNMERILVVEDDRAVQKAMKRLFEAEGFVVEISGDGKSALEAFRAAAPSAVVLSFSKTSRSARLFFRAIADGARRPASEYSSQASALCLAQKNRRFFTGEPVVAESSTRT